MTGISPSCLCQNSAKKISGTLLLILFLILSTGTSEAQDNALSFDGTNDYVAVPALGNNLTQFTIETWFNATSIANSAGFNGIFNSNSWVVGDVHFQINNTKIELAVAGSTPIAVPYNAITVNTWHHLAATYNSITKKINVYINGTLLQSATLATTVSANFTTAQIGAFTTQRYFAGMFDEYRIWSTERSITEIRNNMFTSLAGNETGLLASYNFNQGSAGSTNTGITSLINSKGSNNGTLNNFALTGTTSNWISSTAPLTIADNCLIFNGTNNYVNCGPVNPAKFTIEAWALPTGVSADQAVVSTLFTTANTGCELHIGSDSYPYITIRNGATWLDIKAPAKAVAGVWIHLAATFDGSSCILFVNGIRVASQTSISYNAGTNALFLGVRSGPVLYFSGKIDDVRIWSRVVTEANLLDSINKPLIGSEKGLLAHYSFNQGIANGTNTGLTTLLSSTGTNHGTLTNFTLSGATSNWATAFLPSPASHVTNFTGSLVSNKMTLTWTDATGSVIPDGYLIYASKTNSFVNPVDGVLPADDNDLSDGTGIIRIAKGIQTYNGWTNEEFNTTYFFKIYPLTNPGIPVKYFTSGTVPQIQVLSKQILIPVTSTFPNAVGPHYFDYDNDGYLDLLIGLDPSERTSLYRNNRNSTYSFVTYFNSPGFEYLGGIVDFDLNGYLDIIGINTSRIYFNNGSSFTPTPISNAGLLNPVGEFADFDRDADLDFLTRGSNGYDIKIYRRDPATYNEVFGNSFHPCAGVLKWIDFNNDGYPDIFASGRNPLDGKLYSTLYKNDGNGKFTEQTQIILPVQEDVIIADINSDGRMDILLKGNKPDNTGTVILCTNNAGINFTTLTIGEFYDCSHGSARVVDIDNDGLNDILISANTSDTEGIVKIFRNKGNGTFSDLFIQNIPYTAPLLDLFDLNNDGNIDLVETWNRVFQNTVTSSNLAPNKITTATSVLEGNGVRFNWSATDDKTPAPGLTYELRIGTTTGASNIIAASSTVTGVRKLLVSGNMGNLTTKYLQLPKGTYYWSVQAIDNSFKGGAFSDEKSFTIIDVPSSKLTAEKLDNFSLKLKWTKGNGTKRAVFCKIGTTGTATPVNNKSYIASPNYGEGDQIGTTGWYCVYNGAGDSLNIFNLSSSNSYIFHVTEYNGNSGSESYVITTTNGNPGVFSTAVFSEQPAIPVPPVNGYNSSAYFGDFNNDNLLDFLYNYEAVIYNNTNQGNNAFTQTAVPSSRLLNNSLVNVVDYNNDGWLDYSETGDYYSNHWSHPTYTRFFTNNGNNTFTENLDFNSIGTIDNSMSWGDYDNDGNMDYFIGGNDATVVGLTDWPYVQTNYSKISKIFRNNGAAGSYSFSEQTAIELPGLCKGAAKWGDFNNDGWSDLLFTGFADDNNYYIYLYLNNKNNTFTKLRIDNTTTANPGTFNLKSYLECADFDKDGFLDFILSTNADYDQSNGKATLFRNNGNNTFTQDNTSFSNQTSFNQFAIGDFNNDNAVDVLFMMGGTSFKQLYRNNYPDKSFSVVPDFVSSGSRFGTLSFGDYDNDGDLDVLSSNNNDYICNIIKNSTIMKSGTFPANNLPAAPTNTKTTLTPGQLLISWDKVTTDETSNLSYNLKLEKDGLTINSPNVNLPGSKRKVPEMGNTGMNNFAVMKGLPVGTYSISVQAVDGAFAGGAWSAPVSVELKNTKAFFTFDTVCFKVATKLSDLSTSTKKITSRKWKYNNTVFSTDSVAHFAFPNSGTGYITLVITDGEGTKDSVTHAIKIKARPAASYSATTVCLGTTTQFVNNSSRNGAGTVTWNWNYDNGDPASTDSIPLNKVYGLARTYKTKLIVKASNGCADTLAKDVIVGAIPNAITSVSGKTVFCQGDSVQLIAENNPLYNYQWKLDNNDLSNTNSGSLKVKLNSGAYSVRITNPLANCSATSIQTNVTVLPVPASPYISPSGLTQFCQGDSVTLSISNTAGNSFQWLLNGGAVGDNQNTFVAKSTGSYTVVVTNPSGCTAKSSNQIPVTVFQKPVITKISKSGSTTFCQGENVDLSVPANANYLYKWQNSGADIPDAVSHVFTASGSGVYSLVISNTDGCISKTEEVIVNSLTVPVAPLVSASGPTEFCQNGSVILSVINMPGYTYQWKLNGGAVGTNSNQFTAINSGRYILSVSNNSGCSVSSVNFIDVTVNLNPTLPAVNISGPTTFCQGSNVELSVSGTTGYSYQWENNGAGIPGASAVAYLVQNSGVYSLRITNSSNCSINTENVTVRAVTAPATPLISALGSTTFCQGASVELSVTNNPDYSYDWKLNGGSVGINSNQFSAKNNGSYDLIVSNSTGCSVPSVNHIDVTVLPLPEGSNVILSGATSFCVGGNVTLSVTPNSNYSYTWRNGATTVSSSPVHTANTTGVYQLDIMNSSGCLTRTIPVEITVKPMPLKPVITSEGYQTGDCPPLNNKIKLFTSELSGYTYQWLENGIGYPNRTLSYVEEPLRQGVYAVETSLNGCKTISDNFNISYAAAPEIPKVYAKGPVVWYLATQFKSYKYYKWYYEDQQISGADKYIYVANKKMGTYRVAVANENLCFTSSANVTLPLAKSGTTEFNIPAEYLIGDEQDISDAIKIYPNPTPGLFTIEMDNDILGELNISIATQNGKEILKIKFQKNTEHFITQVDLNGQPHGIYIINLMIDRYFATEKLIVD